jgi:hypothetical protein
LFGSRDLQGSNLQGMTFVWLTGGKAPEENYGFNLASIWEQILLFWGAKNALGGPCCHDDIAYIYDSVLFSEVRLEVTSANKQ